MDQRLCRRFYDLNIKIAYGASIKIGPVLTLHMNYFIHRPTSLFKIHFYYTTCIIRCQFAGRTLNSAKPVFKDKPSDSSD